MCTEVDDDGRLVRLENEVQHGWDLLSGRGRCVQHAARDGDEGREELLHDERKVILALTIPARPSAKPTRRPNQPPAHLNARTHSSAATHPAPTSRISPLFSNAFTLSSNPDHRSGKSCEMRSLSVAPSCTVIVLDGDPARTRKMADLSASRSDCAIGACSGRVVGMSRMYEVWTRFLR